MIKCKDCKWFQRRKWHPAIDKNEDLQLGGDCGVLLKFLQMENSGMFFLDHLYVQDTFSCIFAQEK